MIENLAICQHWWNRGRLGNVTLDVFYIQVSERWCHLRRTAESDDIMPKLCQAGDKAASKESAGSRNYYFH
jgi:hypothetical protein